MEKAPVKGWNYAPNVPIQVSPIFTWPWKPFEILKWVWNSWFLITEKLDHRGFGVLFILLVSTVVERYENP